MLREDQQRERENRQRERLLKEISSDGRVKFMCHREREHTLAQIKKDRSELECQWDVKSGLRICM